MAQHLMLQVAGDSVVFIERGFHTSLSKEITAL